MNTSLLLGLHAHTWIHAGSGEKDGVVDLPIQRESHTGWPVIFGSSLKGAMRSQVSRNNGAIAEQSVLTLFGPDSLHAGATSEKIHAGALLVSDARLLWLPVRSLTSHTRYVTCPALLRRLLADLKRAGTSLALSVPRLVNWTRWSPGISLVAFIWRSTPSPPAKRVRFFHGAQCLHNFANLTQSRYSAN